MSRSFLVPIAFPNGDTFQPGSLKLVGASPFGGNLNLFQDAGRVSQLFSFGPSIILTAEGTSTRLLLQSAGDIQISPGATAIPATGLTAMFRSGSSNAFSLYSPVGIGNLFAEFWPENGANRAGYVGVYSGWLRLAADSAFGLPVMVNSTASNVRVQAATTVDFWSNATYSGSFDASGAFLVGKTTVGVSNVGSQMAASGQIIGTVSTDIAHFIANATGAGVATGHNFVDFRLNNSTIGAIVRNAATSGVLYNTSSDYRLKNELGPLTEGLARVNRLRPVRVTWKEDPTDQEQDSLMAHEVAEVVPEAVTGEKDGEQMQQMDYSRLVPVLVAAVQELSAEVKNLRAEVAALKGAA